MTQRRQKFKCTICNYTVSYKSLLNKHLNAHSRSRINITMKQCRKQRICPICNEPFGSEDMFKKHCLINQCVLTVQEQSKLCTCSTCGTVLKTKAGLIYHIKAHRKEKTIQCSDCNRYFSRTDVLRKHKAICHNYATPYMANKNFGCALCNRGCNGTGDLLKHMVNEHDLDHPFKCHICKKKYLELGSLTFHQLKFHKISAENKNQLCSTIKCSICERSLKSKRNLLIHIISIHLNQKPYKCDFCEKCFTSQIFIRYHKQAVHSNTLIVQENIKFNVLKCSRCPKSFPRNMKLVIHLRQHTCEKPYLCTECGKKFTQNGGLKRHLLTKHSEHYSDTRYLHSMCAICGKVARDKSEILDHIRRHNYEKLFHCDKCVKSYCTSSDLNQHKVKRHNGHITRLACSKCELCYSDRSYLTNHIVFRCSNKVLQ